MGKFFWFCAGANAEILSRDECFLDRGRYTAMGISVLITAFTAAVAGGYAFYSVSDSVDWAIVFAVCWGILIGSIDRVVLMNTRKETNISWKQMVVTALRLLMASVISFTMAKPLEMAIFLPEIRAEIEQQNLQVAIKAEKEAGTGIQDQIRQLQQQNQQLAEQLEDKEAKRDQAYQAAIAEAEGTAGTGLEGRGPVYQEKWEELEKQEQEYKALKQQTDTLIAQNRAEIDQLRQEKESRVERVITAQQDADSLLAQLQALHRLAVNDPIVKWASVLVTTVLVAIDILPIIAKLFAPRGQYDAIVQYEEQATIAREEQKIADFKDTVKEESRYKREIQRQKREFDLESYKDALVKATQSPQWEEAMEEVISAIVEDSKAQLLRKVQNYRIDSAELNQIVRRAFKQVLEEMAYPRAKEQITKKQVEQMMENAIKELEEDLNNFLD